MCCYVPAWFGAIATFFLGMLTMECANSANAGVAAAAIMAVIPAHIMRSGELHVVRSYSKPNIVIVGPIMAVIPAHIMRSGELGPIIGPI